jgi:methylmalonyl-CoA mutase N-terminal domain/subunit
MAKAEERRETDSGIEVKPVYTREDVADAVLELPGEFPFTRGPYPDMYRGRPWTIRQYAGFASAEETNARFRYLLERGQTGLSVAFDLPTQLGLDSDDARAAGEVGRAGVAIDSLADMEILFDAIPLGEVSTSMTINAPAALLLLLYELVAEGQGVAGSELRGTVQNDILKEYVARGNYIFPPRPSMRITTDVFAYCHERLPKWNTISISGYHIREAGSTAVQELGFTLAHGIAYCQAAIDAGLSPDEFGERLSFFFNAHNHFFQEVAKFRAARALWARIMSERFGATNPKAQALRFHAQTGGSTLTAQQPENNIVRVAIQALSAVCGGAQSIHTNRYAEEDPGGDEIELHRLDPEAERRQVERTARVRAERDAAATEAALARVREAAVGTENLLPPMREALAAHSTVGEICNALRDEFGTYDTHNAP